MRVLVISDIHGNLPALDAVLEDAGYTSATWCLGDLVGYGPYPDECISRVRLLPNLVCLIGNHDAAVIETIDIQAFNHEARQTILWTKGLLSRENRAFLHSLSPKTIVDSITLAHGSPRKPLWEYLIDTNTASINFSYFETPYCFVGHSHIPLIYHHPDSNSPVKLILPKSSDRLKMTPRAILNPGSVGQPRDLDPRASYAIFDTEEQTWEIRRVPYDISQVQSLMLKLGMPNRHIVRLTGGW